MTERQKEPRVKLPPVEQIGIVVKDIDKAIQYYSSVFGFGPFRVRESEMKGFTYRGQKGNCRIKTAVAQSGPIEVELILNSSSPHGKVAWKVLPNLHDSKVKPVLGLS